MTIDVQIDREACMGSGNCLFWANKVFDMGQDGIAFILDPEGDPLEPVLLAAQGCPTQAIHIFRDGEKLI